MVIEERVSQQHLEILIGQNFIESAKYNLTPEDFAQLAADGIDEETARSRKLRRIRTTYGDTIGYPELDECGNCIGVTWKIDADRKVKFDNNPYADPDITDEEAIRNASLDEENASCSARDEAVRKQENKDERQRRAKVIARAKRNMSRIALPQDLIDDVLERDSFNLTDRWIDELAKSGIDLATAGKNWLRCIRQPSRVSETRFNGLLNMQWRRAWGDVLVIPYFFGDRCEYVRIKPSYPDGMPEGAPKYISPAGGAGSSRLFFSPNTWTSLDNIHARRVYVTEGEKKAMLLGKLGYWAISIPGVHMGLKSGSKFMLHPDFQCFDWEGIEVVIVFDSDAEYNSNISRARDKLVNAFQFVGAAVGIVRIHDGAADPNCLDGSRLAIDDIYMLHGEDETHNLLTKKIEWVPEGKDDAGSVKPDRLADQFEHHWGKKHAYFYGHYVRDSEKGCYPRTDVGDIQSDAYKFLRENYDNVRSSIPVEVSKQLELRNRVVLSAGEYPPVWLQEPDDPDFKRLDKCLITRKLVVHWPTGKKMPNDESLFTTNAMPPEYDPDAGDQPPLLLRHLRKMLRHQYQIDIVQEYAGYCLTSDTTYQKLLLLLGPPGCGKGTFIRINRRFHGDGRVAEMSLLDLDRQFGAVELPGKSLLIVNDAEMPKGAGRLAKERINNITGEDGIFVESKGVNGKTTPVRLKVILVSNTIIPFQDTSFSLERRLLPIQCYGPDTPREGRDVIQGLSDIIYENESSQILNWKITGLRRLHAQRGFTLMPADSPGHQILETQRDVSSSIKAFIADECKVGAGYTCLVSEMLDRWDDWCDENGHDAGSTQMFNVKLFAATQGVSRGKGTRIKCAGGKSFQPNTYFGIRLNPKPMGTEDMPVKRRRRQRGPY